MFAVNALSAFTAGGTNLRPGYLKTWSSATSSYQLQRTAARRQSLPDIRRHRPHQETQHLNCSMNITSNAILLLRVFGQQQFLSSLYWDVCWSYLYSTVVQCIIKHVKYAIKLSDVKSLGIVYFINLIISALNLYFLLFTFSKKTNLQRLLA